MNAFACTIGIDYSGAQTPTASLKGLRVYLAEGNRHPAGGAAAEHPQILDPQGHCRMAGGTPCRGRAGADRHRPRLSFRCVISKRTGLLRDWPRFLDDFQRHWPADEDHVNVEFVRDGMAGNSAARMGNARWRRLTEDRAVGAKSVFHFNVQGSVGNRPMPAFPGCASSANVSALTCILAV